MSERRRNQPVFTPLSLFLRVQGRVVLLIAAAVLALGFADSARAELSDGLMGCADAGAAGSGYDSCGELDQVAIALADVNAGSVAFGCSVLVVPPEGCTGSATWFLYGDGSGRSSWLDAYGDWQTAEDVIAAVAGAGGGGDGGGGDGGGDGGDISEVDLAEAGSWFAASFMLVVVLFFMGRGIGMVLDVFRRD